MYTHVNFKTKKALKEALKAGMPITVYQPNNITGEEPRYGTVYLEGPHYPSPHTWYAQAWIENGNVVKIK